VSFAAMKVAQSNVPLMVQPKPRASSTARLTSLA